MLNKIKSLPDMCFVFLRDGKPGKFIAIIKNGETGYYPTSYEEKNAEAAKEMVKVMNDKLGVTDLQAECMENGSLFGWGTPGANPLWLARAKIKRQKELEPSAD